ncbi:hypothetical protein KY284_005167 [Solanum tuberosum]|nr:hypothetical protein KY284_005167 [Solanum tuberosum]
MSVIDAKFISAPIRGFAHGAPLTRGHAREVSPQPHVEVDEDQAPSEFIVSFFQDAMLSMQGVLEIFSHDGTVGTPHVSQMRVGEQTPWQHQAPVIYDQVG